MTAMTPDQLVIHRALAWFHAKMRYQASAYNPYFAELAHQKLERKEKLLFEAIRARQTPPATRRRRLERPPNG